MVTTVTVTITPVAEATELYRHEQGRPAPQEVRMHLDIESGTLNAAYIPLGDEHSIPASVYHHRGALWTIPCLTSNAAIRLMTEAMPLCQRIVNGTEIEWDGQNNVGTRNADAQAAIDEVAELIETYDDVDNVIQELTGDEYYDDGTDAALETLGINADTTDAELARIVEAAAAEALDINVVIPDLGEYISQLRDDLRNDLRDDLRNVADDLTRLTHRRDELICRQLAWGDTTRDVGTRAGMTHVGVREKSMKLAILNTSIVTTDGSYTLESIIPETAIHLASIAELDSAVGHESTAQILSTILGVEVPVNRQLFAQSVGQQALIFKLNGRPEPGRELSRKELEEIGFGFKLLTRTA